jgi:hypothetical protein
MALSAIPLILGILVSSCFAYSNAGDRGRGLPWIAMMILIVGILTIIVGILTHPKGEGDRFRMSY